MSRWAAAILILVSTSAPTFARAQTFIMHAVESAAGQCAVPDPCDSPDTAVPVGEIFTAYLFVRNYETVQGLQTAFDWNDDWQLLGANWTCQPNQVNAQVPTAPGPVDGTLTTTFDCIAGFTSAIIGGMLFLPSSVGCLEQIESALIFGSHARDCTDDILPVGPECRGSICAGSSGANACYPDGCSPGGGQTAQTPIVGVEPQALDFGAVCVAHCDTLTLSLFNDVIDPKSVLEIVDLRITGSDFELVDPPALPLQIPGDLTLVPLAVRYCPIDAGLHMETLTIESSNGANFEVDVTLSGVGDVGPGCTTGVAAHANAPAPRFYLAASQPNPSHPSAVLRFGLERAGRATLRLFDAAGHRVRTLVDGVRAAGEHEVRWDGRDTSGRPVASGVYFYRLEANGRVETRSMTLVR